MTNAGEIREKFRTTVDRIGERYFVDPSTETVGPKTIEHWKVALGAFTYRSRSNVLLVGRSRDLTRGGRVVPCYLMLGIVRWSPGTGRTSWTPTNGVLDTASVPDASLEVPREAILTDDESANDTRDRRDG